ncbi:TPA: serine--tRNA ligase [Candidatus Woesearchaeota archaeon]|nr:serine--tRNA ligase [Candidatus Woesearchaeota archaeon]
MLDIKYIAENKELVKDNIRKKNRDNTETVDKCLEKYEEYKKLLQEIQELKTEKNKASQEVNRLKKEKKDATAAIAQVKELPVKIKEKEEELSKAQEEMADLQKAIPMMLHESVPIGKNDKENVVRQVTGKPEIKDFDVLSHVEICEKLGIADFDAASRVSGNGFFYLKKELAMLNQALIRFATEFMIRRGFIFVEPPLMMREEVLRTVMPPGDFAEHAYKLQGTDLVLIATSEHPLLGMFYGQIIDKKQLPIKMCGYSQCFRQEIGSHGIDEKGLFRTHQFNKVEMVVICEPEDSFSFYDEMLGHSVELFKQLGIPTRVLESCSGDLGDLKSKGADLEAWSPRRKEYFEVCSVSNITDAQARRMGCKVFDGEKRYHPHMLNNTVIATSRAMVAVLENYQNADGTVTIPEVLAPYMDGKTRIGPE